MQLCACMKSTIYHHERHIGDKIDSYMDKVWGINVSNLCIVATYVGKFWRDEILANRLT